jgi:hypothetical protein
MPLHSGLTSSSRLSRPGGVFATNCCLPSACTAQQYATECAELSGSAEEYRLSTFLTKNGPRLRWARGDDHRYINSLSHRSLIRSGWFGFTRQPSSLTTRGVDSLKFQEAVEALFPQLFWAFAGFVARGARPRWSQAPRTLRQHPALR